MFSQRKEQHFLGIRYYQPTHLEGYTPYWGVKRVSMWVRLKYAIMNLKKLAMWKCKAAYRQYFITMSMPASKKNRCFATA